MIFTVQIRDKPESRHEFPDEYMTILKHLWERQYTGKDLAKKMGLVVTESSYVGDNK